MEGLAYSGARGATRTWPWVLVSAALLCAVAAVGFSHIEPPQRTAAHLLAASYGLLAAAAILWTSTERALRESQRRPYFLLAGIGTVIVLCGQSIGYLVTLGEPGPFDPRVELIPLLVGMPMAGAGAILLAWPRGMSRRERWLVVIDSALGISALAVIWLVVVIPRWAAPADPRLTGVVTVDQVALFTGIALIVVLMAASRRLGALPLPQLLLLLGGMLLWLLSDLFGELGPDRTAGVSVSIIGYTLAVAMLMGMGVRSVAETETSRQTRWRDGLSLVLPMVLLLIAGFVLIDASPLRGGARLAADAAWLTALCGLTLARLASLEELRAGQNLTMVQTLSASAARGWVGTLLRDSAEYVLVLDARGQIVFTSPRTQSDLLEAVTFSELALDPEPSEIETILAGVTLGSIPAGPHEMLLRGRDGGQREVEVHVRPVRDINFEGFVVTGTDVSAVRLLEQNIDRTRRRDELTGLLTGEAILTEVAATLAAPGRNGVLFAVLDLSDFAVWNESLGRTGGDDILRTVAAQFEGLPREVTAVSRMVGDSFGLLMTSPSVASTLEQVLDIVRRSFVGLILPSDIEVDLGFRLGYSVAAAGDTVDPSQLMDQAGVALRRARKSRQAQVVRFRPGMNEDLVNRLAAELRIREALNSNGIVVHYQPILSLVDGSVRSVEALARIGTEHAGLVGPAQFMEAAEYSGLVEDIDRHVRRQVAADWSAIAAVTGPGLRININVSQSELTPHLAEELRAMRLTERVVVEVTEASLLTNPHLARETLETIRSLGGKVAIDDFGTGYSSLSQIVALPCDILKIDRSFVSDMSETSTTSSLVRAMVQLADDIGLQTVAEGVETGEQAAILRAIGCDGAQGFHYSRPLPLDELVRWVSAHRAAAASSIPAPATYPQRGAATLGRRDR